MAKKLGNVNILRMTSMNAVNNFQPNSADIVFIDAIHTYKSCKEDIIEWLKIVKPGGILAGHDFSLSFYGVVLAVTEILGIDNIRIGKDSTWFYQK
jgi:predicted O-methyltransferase YrrM